MLLVYFCLYYVWSLVTHNFNYIFMMNKFFDLIIYILPCCIDIDIDIYGVFLCNLNITQKKLLLLGVEVLVLRVWVFTGERPTYKHSNCVHDCCHYYVQMLSPNITNNVYIPFLGIGSWRNNNKTNLLIRYGWISIPCA